MGMKYAIVILGTDFGISNFRDALYKRFPYNICGTPKREDGKFEMQVQFSKCVIDEKLKQFLELTHPYVDIDAQGNEVHFCTKAGVCCCEEVESL
jgi:hypothetical protein